MGDASESPCAATVRLTRACHLKADAAVRRTIGALDVACRQNSRYVTVECAYRSPHSRIRFEVQARVNRTVAAQGDSDASPSLPPSARGRGPARRRTPGPGALHRHVAPRAVVPEIAAFARDHRARGDTALAVVRSIGSALNETMRFDMAPPPSTRRSPKLSISAAAFVRISRTS